jgi:tetratricopeptide (TPR) repeat protein
MFGVAHADDRADARTHYQAGVKSYAAADYKTAIKEFGAAQQLAPADLNNYNHALCYDKLGEAEPAIQYYKEYLNKVPDAPKRSEIEASISRLDGALKSASTKKADEQKKADEAKKAADDAKRAEDAKKAPAAPPIDSKVDEPKPIEGTGVGSTGTPSTGLTVSTGDAQLDRVQGINIDAIRDQRVGGASSGMP